MGPIVSVIIPNYNHAAFLHERLDSVINQTYTNFEIIILDDASTDASKEVIEKYQINPKVTQAKFNTKNSGSPFLQWIKGIELAKGKYIWIAESDDICRLNFLETLVPLLEKNSELMLIYSDSERDSLGWRKVQQTTSLHMQVDKGEKFIRQKMLISPIIINASAVLFRRKAVQETILLESYNYKTAFDWLFWCSIILQGKVAFYPQKLNYFRKHLESTSLKNTKKGLFVTEGLHVMLYLKKTYHIVLNRQQIKTWSSVWAQTCLLTNNTKALLLQNISQANTLSPMLLLYFTFYLLKYKFFSNPNMKMLQTE